ncbi:MAG: pilus assembly protein [Alphaproteobacteria bacterium]|nr:pilus assembly protein [Alphaproteobacteria bacterium]
MLEIIRNFRGLRRQREGSTTVEFAFAMPILAAALIGLVELSMIMLVTTLMEGGLRQAARFGVTGFVPAGVTREQRILDILAEQTIGLVDIGQAQVTTLIYPDFEDIGEAEPYTDDSPANGNYDVGEDFVDVNGNGQWDADMGASGAGDAGDIVVYRITYDWDMLTGLLDAFIGQNGAIQLTASVAVQNEPF